jgi:hypothetical protein
MRHFSFGPQQDALACGIQPKPLSFHCGNRGQTQTDEFRGVPGIQILTAFQRLGIYVFTETASARIPVMIEYEFHKLTTSFAQTFSDILIYTPVCE